MSGHIYTTSHNTRNANQSLAHHSHKTPGDRLVAPATARPPRKRRIAPYDPDFGDGGDVWQKAEARSLKPAHPTPSLAPKTGTRTAVPTSSSSSTAQDLPRENFAGILDHLEGNTMVNEFGFPLNESDLERMRRETHEEPTSQGKVCISIRQGLLLVF